MKSSIWPRPFRGTRAAAKARGIRRVTKPLSCALLTLTVLGGCEDQVASSKPPLFVLTDTIAPDDRETSVTLTGDIQARVSADLAFRVSGRVVARTVDVGAHVDKGDVLAKLDPTEQQADLDAATAAVAAAESQLRVATATYERQQTLLAKGFTTRVAFDQAQEGLRSAEGSLEAARAQLGISKDAFDYTELRAGASGVITARNIEVGQVVQAAQPAFGLAQDGDRDAVFDVYESIFFRQPEDDKIELTLVSDRTIKASGRVREVSPTIDPKNATVRVKVAIADPPRAMTLGSAVAGTARRKSAGQITVPWSALTAIGSAPAVWVVEPARTVSLRPVMVDGYESGFVVIKSGLQAGERVVVDGGKLLSMGQSVTYDETAK